MYIFFASALPVIAFGEQLSRDTGASLSWNADKRNISLSFCLYFISINWKWGSYFNLFFLQILIVFRWKIEHRGNISLNCAVWNYPLNLWGTAFVDFRSGRTNCYNVHLLVQFLPRPARVRRRSLFSLGWMVSELVFQILAPFFPCLGGNFGLCLLSLYVCRRVCIWTGFFLILLAIFNACTVITKFTRVAGELFGMLIAVLFFQEAIKVLLIYIYYKRRRRPE